MLQLPRDSGSFPVLEDFGMQFVQSSTNDSGDGVVTVEGELVQRLLFVLSHLDGDDLTAWRSTYYRGRGGVVHVV